jgi:hypothetical protein
MDKKIRETHVKNILRNCLAAGLVLMATAGAARAEDAEAAAPAMPSAAVIAQLALADQVIANGVERNDPLLIIAGVRLRSGITEEAAAVPAASMGNDDALAKAAELAADREDILGIIEDMKSETGRGDYYTSSGSYCYTVGSATVCY